MRAKETFSSKIHLNPEMAAKIAKETFSNSYASFDGLEIAV